ncbi:MAG: hypothetical protein JWP81_3730 [Ferruginibacter sp.]|nr:hypothetical protein [Ferruginibacter sp.]
MLLFTLWSIIGAGTIVLLVAAIQKKDANKCIGIDITIKGVSNNFFVDKNDILNTIAEIAEEQPVGKPVGSFNLKAMEAALQKNTWIKTAQLFFDNNERLQVNVMEREPVARVFSTGGTTFYIDSSVAMLPLSDKFSARLPVFTGFPSDKKVLVKADSNLLRDIVTISEALQVNPFDMAMIDQVDITPLRTFEMIPKFGNTIIVLGDAKNVFEKLDKLRLFYKQVVVKAGWNKYSEINLQYSNQVVARRKGAEDVKADSLKTLQLMQIIAENAERMAGDSLQTIIPDNEHNTTNSSIIQESIERNDNSPSTEIIEKSLTQEDTTVAKPSLPKPTQVAVSKPTAKGINQPTVIKKPLTQKKPASTNNRAVVKPNTTSTKTPKLLMPKPAAKKPAVTKPYNEYEQ